MSKILQLALGVVAACAFAPNAQAASGLDSLVPAWLFWDNPSADFVPDEQNKRLKPTRTHMPAGALTLTVRVPTTATSQHGVGIDGGVYRGIEGGPTAVFW